MNEASATDRFSPEFKNEYLRLLGSQPQERDWGRAYVMLAEEVSRVLEVHAAAVESSASDLRTAVETASKASETHAAGLVWATWGQPPQWRLLS